MDENVKLRCRSRHHHWICGTKLCQMAINLALFWQHQNPNPWEYRIFPKYSLLEISAKSTTQMKILSTPLRSLWNYEKNDYKFGTIPPLSKIIFQGNLKIPQASKNIPTRFFLEKCAMPSSASAIVSRFCLNPRAWFSHPLPQSNGKWGLCNVFLLEFEKLGPLARWLVMSKLRRWVLDDQGFQTPPDQTWNLLLMLAYCLRYDEFWLTNMWHFFLSQSDG